MARIIDPGYVFEDDGSNPLASGRVYFYTSGTATLKATYSDADRTVQNPNPMTIGSDGRLSVDVYGTGSYTVRVVDVNGALIWTEDNVSAFDASVVEYTNGSTTRTVAERLSDTIHVADYGAVGDGSTDDTAAIQAAVTALTASGGGTLLFDNLSYRIYPSGSFSGTHNFISLSSINGITIDGRGALLTVEDTFTGSEVLRVFNMSAAKNITIRNFRLTSQITYPNSRGVEAFRMTSNCENVVIENIVQVGGYYGVECVRTVATEAVGTTCRNIRVANLHSEDVYYPFSFQHSGERVTVDTTKVLRPGKAYHAYGVKNHVVNMTVVDAQVSPAFDLSCYTVDSSSNYLENMDLTINQENTSASLGANWVGLKCYVETTPTGEVANIRNIRLKLYGNVTHASKSLLTLAKLDTAEAQDTTARGHIIEGLYVTGNVRYEVTNTSPPISLMSSTSSQGTWTSTEVVSGILFEDFIITHTGFSAPVASLIDTDAIIDNLVFDNILFPATVTFEGSFARGVTYRNSKLAAIELIDAANSVQTLTGAGAVDLVHKVTHLVTTGTDALTLADGVEGQEKIIIMKTDGGDGTLTPANYAGPGTTIVFNSVGDVAQLFFTNGKWHPLSGALSGVSLGTSGYSTDPNGVTYQWGGTTTSTTANTNHAVTFPTPYTTVYRVVACPRMTTQVANAFGVNSETTTGFNFFINAIVPGFSWIATGLK